MAKKLYVGNLSYGTTQEAVRELFEQVGEVAEVNLITDRDSGRPKGFGFVEMASAEDGNKAIAELDGSEFDGRQLKVNEAKPREDRGGGGGYGGGGGGRGGNRGGGGGGGYGGGNRGGGSRW